MCRSRTPRAKRRLPCSGRVLALSLAAAAGLASCREAPEAIVSAERTPAPVVYPLQLTYDLRDDRAPAWSADGDSVYYVQSTGSALGVPTTRIMAIPADAGIAAPAAGLLAAPSVAPGEPLLALAPRIARSGDRAVFAQVTLYHAPGIAPNDPGARERPTCTGNSAAFEDAARGPRLGRIRLHARGAVAASVEIELPGRGFAEGVPPVFYIHYYPFHRLWESAGVVPFQPSWSADGGRVVTSNGIELLVWDVTSGIVTPLGATDAVSPAWSPDGDRIVFARNVRADSASAFCVHPGALGPAAYQYRTVYQFNPPALTVLDLAAGATTELGAGSEPAWSPDGRYVYARRDDAIWRIDVNGGGAVMVHGTENGREPAVSPDGRLLAFSKLGPRGNYDVWIALVPEP